MAKLIQMPGPRQRMLLAARYGLRGLGDSNSDGGGITPWYSNPVIVMGTMLGAGLLLGGIGRPHVDHARKRVRKQVSNIDWGTIGAVVAASAITGALSYIMGSNKNNL